MREQNYSSVEDRSDRDAIRTSKIGRSADNETQAALAEFEMPDLALL
jgi:hypothetical protein